MKRVFLLLLLTCCLLTAPAAAAGGSGTAADPYIVQTAVELQSMQNNLAAYYKLANDINLQDISFIPIGSTSSPFIGSFDGAGYTISNLVISSSTQSTGFFSCLSSGATVKNTIFQDSSVSSTSSECGVVIGSIKMSSSSHETAVISDVDCVRCSASVGVQIVGCLVGIITASAVVEITDCDVLYSHARAINNHVSCLVGVCDGLSSLVIDSSTVKNSIADSATSNYIGCLLGSLGGDSTVNILNCDVVNCIACGGLYVGGLYGSNWGGSFAASDCTVTGCTIVADSNYAGGIVGRIESEAFGIISGCTVTDSTILARNYAAGVCPA